jgi:RHS repeat-associated protein
MSYRRLPIVAAGLAWLAALPSAGAVGLPAPGAVSPQTVKLPDGPGSIRGLASDASVSAFTGQVSYEIPIELPGGPGGLAPKLALSYSGALGNGPLGLGWSLGQIGVRRSLRLGVPSYTTADELELIGLPGGTLVAIDGSHYRAEGQGNAIRGAAVDGGFELVDPAGNRYRIGTSEASRLASGGQVAAWYLERVTDVAGHVIDYHYDRLGNELYLGSITWGGADAFRAELVYEDRPDAVVSWRTGFKITDGRRLAKIRLWSFGAVRRTVELTYDQTFALSRLATVRVVGRDGTASPTTTLAYATTATPPAQLLTNTGGWSLGDPTVSFFDVDKDGAMDLLRVEASGQRYRRNLGGSFGPEVALRNPPALAMSAVRMLDLDGDSGAEMVARSGAAWRSYRIVNGGWVATDWPGSAAVDLQGVALADLNGDNRMDALVASGAGISVWFGTANGFAPPVALPRISANEPAITPATVQLPDLNGDGLADAVQLNSNGLLELRGRGDGTFERVGLIAYPWTGTTDVSQVRLADLDRDGLLDVIRVGTSQVAWYRGKPDGTFATQARLLSRPPGADATTIVGLADANGNGSTDVVWSSTSGMWALDLAGATNAGLLVAIDNGLGKTQTFDYTASTKLAWAAETAGAAWTERMPVSIAVTTTARLALASGEPDRLHQLAVRDGIYEPVERRFLGFAESTLTAPGPTAATTIRTITRFHPGRGADRALRGQVISARTEDGAGAVFQLVENQLAALSVADLPDDPRLKRAAITQVQTTHSEPGDAPAVIRTRYAFDAEGRQIEERRDGALGIAGDESITRQTYTAEDPVTGVRDLVCKETLLDGSEQIVSQRERHFGDASPTIAAPCQPGNGWVREELGFLDREARWVIAKRASYDPDGNAVVTEEAGVVRTVAYDAHGLHPVRESVAPAAGQALAWIATWDDVDGTLIRVDAPSGTAARMTYDGLGRLTSLAANAAPPHTYYRYDQAAPRPMVETFTFDGDPAALGDLPATWTPGAGWRHTVEVINGAGERILTAAQLDAARWNIAEHRTRDHRGRVIGLASPFDFDGADPRTATPPANGAAQALAYDPLDRVIDVALPTGDHKRTAFHPLGATVSVDGLAPVHTALDGQGRVVHTERTIGATVEAVDASYDAAGRITRFSLQGGLARHDFTYDSLGRLVGTADPDGGPRTMTYDDAGRIVATLNGAGDAVRYGYDGAGRLASVDGAGVTTRFHYDAARRAGFDHTAAQLAWVEEPSGTVDLGYDDRGRQTVFERAVTIAGQTTTAREATELAPSGLVRAMDLGDGVVLPLRYDAAGRVAEVEGAWAVEAYDAANLPVRERFANGAIQRTQRDVLSRPSEVILEATGGVRYDVAATYQPSGALASLEDRDHVGLDHTAAFGYDGAGRLTAAAIGAYQFSYAYDGLQNLVARTASGPTALAVLAGTYQYQPGAPRRLDRVVADGQALAQFAYDGAGRQIAHADKQLHYDALSRLVRIDGAGGTVAHAYGYDGKRVATTGAAGEVTVFPTPNVIVRGAARDHYVRVGDRLIAKITTGAPAQLAASAARRDRTALAGLSLCWILGLGALAWRTRGARALRAMLSASLALLVMTTGCAPRIASQTGALAGDHTVFFHQSYAAGPELVTDQAGALVEERRSEPFGVAIDELRDGAVAAVDYRRDPANALGKLSDPDTGWSDHGARWLAPETGQWTRPDPAVTAPDPAFMAAPWSLNPYQYGSQNPVSYWDPDGRQVAANTLTAPWIGIPLAAPAAPVAGVSAAAAAPVVALGAVVLGGAVVGVKLIEAGTAAAAAGEPGPIYCSDPFECMAADFGAHLEQDAINQGPATAATQKELEDAQRALAAKTAELKQAIAAEAKASEDEKPRNTGYYRGGASMAARPGEYKVKGGLVQSTHGVSLYNNPRRVEKWGVFVVVSMPPSLTVIPRPGAKNDPEHFEMVPAKPMSEADYKAALDQVVLAPYTGDR